MHGRGPPTLGGGLLQAGAGEIADRLGAVGVAARAHEAVKLGVELVVDGDGHALHRCLPNGGDAILAPPAAISAAIARPATARH